MVTAPSEGWICSIDFGTCNTTGAVQKQGESHARLVVVTKGGSLLEETQLPSLVFYGREGLVVGREARDLAVMSPGRLITAPKLALGAGLQPHPEGLCDVCDEDVDVRIPAPEICGAILGYVWNACLEEIVCWGGDAHNVELVLTYPAAWMDESRVEWLRLAAKTGGLPDCNVVPEPIAAAHAMMNSGEHCPALGGYVLAYDLGGGSCDVAVMRTATLGPKVLAAGGCLDVGGEEFDSLLFDCVLEKVAGQGEVPTDLLRDLEAARRAGPEWLAARIQLLEDITRAREELSEQSSTLLSIWWPSCESAGGPVDLELARAELEGLLSEPISRTVDEVEAVLRRAQVTASQLSAVYLVGGASMTPCVRGTLEEHLGLGGNVIAAGGMAKASVALGAVMAVTVEKPESRGAGANPESLQETAMPGVGSNPEVEKQAREPGVSAAAPRPNSSKPPSWLTFPAGFGVTYVGIHFFGWGLPEWAPIVIGVLVGLVGWLVTGG